MHTGVILINIGTPSAPEPKAVRRFLARFLFDKRVITLPLFFRFLLVRCIIAPFRSKKSAKEYQKVWMTDGSPLLVYTQRLVAKLQTRLGTEYGIHYAMRYSDPDVEHVLGQMKQVGYRKIVAVPMYPQNASSTTGSSVEELFRVVGKWNEVPGITIVPPFFDNKHFLSAISTLLKDFAVDRYDHVLFSYHGLPESHLAHSHKTVCDVKNCNCEFSDDTYHCYKAQCLQTSRLIAQQVGLTVDGFTTSFQSRFSANWIGPFTDEVVNAMPPKGIKRLLVLCPAFTVDCLETVAEIGMDLKASFLDNGGVVFALVPCLNDSDVWANELALMIKEA